MLEKVTKGINKLVIRYHNGKNDVNCYLVKGDNGYTVMDTGINTNEAKDLWEDVFDSGIKIEKVILTHTHEDHIGQAKWFQQEKGVPVYIFELGLPEMEKRYVTGNREQLDQLIKDHGGTGFPAKDEEDFSIYDFQPDGLIKENERIKIGEDYYETIWTPGHAPDHFCFYNQEKKIMFTGDHVLKDISPVIGLWSGKESNILSEYYQSLERIKKYPSDLALPGHGDVFYNFSERVSQLKSRHDQRLQEVYESIHMEKKTAYQLCQEIYGNLNKRLLVAPFMAILTRLIYLEEAGKISREIIHGKVKFKTV
ncbi:MBL fold metallo-hydrolase [Virgibacillus byunsanensis]|uniref:MBL fold metallo-hydrolase n=1 Tax=Virgibacillus byunsanensis TaxID=570945 RepID=A0ABW3LP71_9BACI